MESYNLTDFRFFSLSDTYTYGYSRRDGIKFVRQTGIFQESGRYDQDTLDRIAALMEQENQGRLQNPNIFRPEIINNRGEHFFRKA